MAVNAKASETCSASDGQPPAAGDGIAHKRVAEVQRVRLLAAMVAEVAERGVADVSVAHVVERAGVSRRTFYELFADREDCLLAAFDDALARVAQRVGNAYDPTAPWALRVRAGLVAILAFLDVEPAAAQLLIVGSLGAGARALEHRRHVLAQMAAAIDEGRMQGRAGDLSPLTAEGVVGGVLSILQARLIAIQGATAEGANGALGLPSESFTALAAPLMAMIVHPYLGAAAARRESVRPAPKPGTAPAAALVPDPLRGLDMRLTYRTMRVLTAVADRPGSSNRQVGRAAEIDDQGQVSKLLARLRRHGLIENGEEKSPARGEPNAWRLTPRGEEVHQSLARLEG